MLMPSTKNATTDVSWIVSWIRAALHIMLLVVPLTWSASTSELFEFPKMLVVYLGTMIILALWFTAMLLSKRVLIRRTPLDIFIVLYLVSHLISTLLSIDPHTSWWGYYSRFHGGLMSTLAYTTLYYVTVSLFGAKDIRKFVVTILLAGALSSLYAFPEHFGHSPSCALITGNFDASCWVQDVQTRVFGTFGQPNWLAAYLIAIMLVPLGYALYQLSKKSSATISERLKKPWTLASIVSFTLFFLVLLFTKSRSGLLGLAVGMVIFLVVTISTSLRRSKHVATLSFVVLASMLGLFVLFGKGVVPQYDRAISNWHRQLVGEPVSTLPETTPERQVGTQLDTGGTESGDIRKIVWRGAIEVWKQYPMFGSGLETFAYSYYGSRPMAHNMVSEWDFLYNKAHNEFLNELATAGLAGLATMLGLMLVYSWGALDGARDKDLAVIDRILIAAMLAGYWALAISNFFGFSTVPVGMLFFLFPAYTFGLLHEKDEPTKVKAEHPGFVHYIGLTFVAIGMMYGLISWFSMLSGDISYNKGKKALGAGSLQTALPALERATQLNPHEGLYAEELSLGLAQAASTLAGAGQATTAAKLAEQAIEWSDASIALNSVHLNFYKTRARVFIYLSQINPSHVKEALQSLITAASLAPTDPKIAYNIGLLYEQLGELETARDIYIAATEMKPNYEDPRLSLGDVYVKLGEPDKAKEQYLYILEKLKADSLPVIERLGTLEQLDQ